MADKYIIQGAANNGDGTTSSEAASPGGAGAWNHIDIITGSAVGAGTMNAGDTVHIRSKTSAGADIVVSVGSAQTLGVVTASGLSTAWIVDGGEVWPGIAGTVTFEVTGTTSSAFWLTLRPQNVFSGTARNLIFKLSSGNTVYTGAMIQMGSIAGDCVTLRSAIVSNSMGTNITLSPTLIYPKQASNVVIEDVEMHARTCTEAVRFDDYNAGYSLSLVGCEIELLSGYSAGHVIACQAAGSGSIEVIGGRVYGAGLTPGKSVFNVSSRGISITAHGLIFPRTVSLTNSSTTQGALATSSGADGIAGILALAPAGTYDSRDDGFYPYLNAAMPDANQFSLRLLASRASPAMPLRVAPFEKFYGQTTAARTVTLELLVNSTKTPTANTIWMSVCYVDGSGLPRTQSTYALAAALSSSSATWSAVSYGPVGFNKHKLTLTTANSIKQGTVVSVSLWWGIAALDADDVGFVDPAFDLA